jgi:hypothetical protein
LATPEQPIAPQERSTVPPHATIQPVGTARKPVIVRKLTRDWCAGYAHSDLTALSGGNPDDLEMLDAAGKLLQISWTQVKWVCFVRELTTIGISGADTVNPERLLRRKFTTRPRMSGLWLRLVLTDGDELEGVVANDRSLIDSAGLMLTPPDTRSNTQRVFVPMSAIRELTILGVIGPSAKRMRGSSLRGESQPDLFANEEAGDSGDSNSSKGNSVTIGS